MPPDPPDPNEGLMQMAEGMLPMIEFAEGQKTMMMQRGWSPGAAEQYAMTLLTETMKAGFSAVQR